MRDSNQTAAPDRNFAKHPGIPVGLQANSSPDRASLEREQKGCEKSRGKESGVLEQIERLEKSVSWLEQEISDLHATLSPITAMSTPEVAGPSPEPPSWTEVQESIRIQRSRVDLLASRIHDLNDRIGL